jgi:pimeloyl-ACP methyl ester carboxylesterase
MAPSRPRRVVEGGIRGLLIHGNSFCRCVFRNQLRGWLAETHRLIAFDLPVHGQSGTAPDPMRSYTRSGLADAAVELLEKLGVAEAIVLGMSLGGHIGVEMVYRFSRMRGLMIVGSPPVGRNDMAHGFKGTPQMGVACKQDLSEADIVGSSKRSSAGRRNRFFTMRWRVQTAVSASGSSRQRALEKAWTSA